MEEFDDPGEFNRLNSELRNTDSLQEDYKDMDEDKLQQPSTNKDNGGNEINYLSGFTKNELAEMDHAELCWTHQSFIKSFIFCLAYCIVGSMTVL